MKLYNLFEEVILEESKRLLTENVSDQQIIDAINGRYNVNILYDDYPDSSPSVQPSKRYIQVYNIGNTKAGNKAIRAFQIFGGSKTTPKQGAWKVFRLDRIRGWFPTQVKFARPVSDKDPSLPKYNDSMGGQEKPNSPMGRIDTFVNFNKQNTPAKEPMKKDSYYAGSVEPMGPIDTSSTTATKQKR